MKKSVMYATMLAVVTGTIFVACNKDQEDITSGGGVTLDKSELTVYTEIASKSQTGVVSSWQDGDHLGLFITKGSLGTYYNDYSGYSNVKSSRKDAGWLQEPSVYLSSESAVIYAYYPYVSTSYAGTGTAIPLDVSTQTDYMYGTHASSGLLNSDNPDVLLNMKHATALLQFNMYKNKYTATGKVTKIKLTGTAGVLYKTANLNCQTGALIMKEEAGTTGIFIENNNSGLLSSLSSSPSSIETYYPKLLVLPATGRMTGDLVATFTIDGKDYEYKFPSSTTFESGKKYTYTICLSGTEVSLGGNSMDGGVKVDDWGTGQSGNVELQ